MFGASNSADPAHKFTRPNDLNGLAALLRNFLVPSVSS